MLEEIGSLDIYRSPIILMDPIEVLTSLAMLKHIERSMKI